MLSRKFPIPSLSLAPLPTHSHFLALAFPCIGAYKVCNTKEASLPSDGPLGHLLLHMQHKTQENQEEGRPMGGYFIPP